MHKGTRGRKGTRRRIQCNQAAAGKKKEGRGCQHRGCPAQEAAAPTPGRQSREEPDAAACPGAQAVSPLTPPGGPAR